MRIRREDRKLPLASGMRAGIVGGCPRESMFGVQVPTMPVGTDVERTKSNNCDGDTSE